MFITRVHRLEPQAILKLDLDKQIFIPGAQLDIVVIITDVVFIAFVYDYLPLFNTKERIISFGELPQKRIETRYNT